MAPLTIVADVHATTYTTTLSAGQWLYPGDQLLSTNSNFYGGIPFQLAMQTDANLVLYAPQPSGTDRGRSLWSTGTGGNSIQGAWMQTDGNFVVYNASHTAIWALSWQGVTPQPGSYLRLQTDGNLVIYNSANTALWSTGTYSARDTASLDARGTGTCWLSGTPHLCRNTWTGTNTSVYFRAIDQFSSAQPEWASPAQAAINAWEGAPGPQFYSYTAHANDTWVFLVASTSGSNGLTSQTTAITWNCFASSGSCCDCAQDGTVYYTNIYFNQAVMPHENPLTSADSAAVQNTFAHESGHAMLLGHNPISPPGTAALMWPQANPPTGPSSYDTGTVSQAACSHGGFGTVCVYGYS